MDSTGIKIMLVTLLMSGAVSAPACSVSFPPSYIDLEDEAYSPELDIHFHLCALARHYFPDCVVLTKNSAGTPPAASPPEPTEAEERLFEAGWEALKRNPEERFPAAWRKLLSLPEKERRSRMLGRDGRHFTIYLLERVDIVVHEQTFSRSEHIALVVLHRDGHLCEELLFGHREASCRERFAAHKVDLSGYELAALVGVVVLRTEVYGNETAVVVWRV